MDIDDCISKDCGTIYRFQFASIAFLCGVLLPYTFHTNIWSIYTKPFSTIDCSRSPDLILTHLTNSTTKSNRSICCSCEKRSSLYCDELLNGGLDSDIRKATVIEEWNLVCGSGNSKTILYGSISFLIAECIGVLTINILADQYGRKLLLLMCLYIPVLFGSLAAFTTTYTLFIVLRWPVGFLNQGLLPLAFIMVIESCEYRHRAQIGCLLLASVPVFGIMMESRRWYVNSHRVSRVNKFLQLCSKQTTGLGKVSKNYCKEILPTDAIRVAGTLTSLFFESRLRTITCCLSILWFLSSFCYHCALFPIIVTQPAINFVLMNAVEFFSFIIALIIAFKIGRRAPLAVLTLISGLSSVSLAITLLGKEYSWLNITFTLLSRGCLRTCYCLLILYCTELYPTSVRCVGLALGLAGSTVARLIVEILLWFSIDRSLLLFISGGSLCLSCCVVFPLPETLLYDLPDSLTDLESMSRSMSTDNATFRSNQTFDMSSNLIEKSNNIQLSSDSITTATFNDLSINNGPIRSPTTTSLHPSILKQQKSVTIQTKPEIINSSSTNSTSSTPSSPNLKAITNPCYFSSINDIDESTRQNKNNTDFYDIEHRTNNRVERKDSLNDQTDFSNKMGRFDELKDQIQQLYNEYTQNLLNEKNFLLNELELLKHETETATNFIKNGTHHSDNDESQIDTRANRTSDKIESKKSIVSDNKINKVTSLSSLTNDDTRVPVDSLFTIKFQHSFLNGGHPMLGAINLLDPKNDNKIVRTISYKESQNPINVSSLSSLSLPLEQEYCDDINFWSMISDSDTEIDHHQKLLPTSNMYNNQKLYPIVIHYTNSENDFKMRKRSNSYYGGKQNNQHRHSFDMTNNNYSDNKDFIRSSRQKTKRKSFTNHLYCRTAQNDIEVDNNQSVINIWWHLDVDIVPVYSGYRNQKTSTSTKTHIYICDSNGKIRIINASAGLLISLFQLDTYGRVLSFDVNDYYLIVITNHSNNEKYSIKLYDYLGNFSRLLRLDTIYRPYSIAFTFEHIYCCTENTLSSIDELLLLDLNGKQLNRLQSNLRCSTISLNRRSVAV
ncbi:unnamed protein product, partial [Didymodactylos carnosus]